MPDTANYIPNPNAAFGWPDAGPGQDGGSNWQLTQLRGVFVYQNDQFSYTSASTSVYTAITGTFALVTVLNQPLEITWGGEFYNTTALDGVIAQLTRDGVAIGPSMIVTSSTANAAHTVEITYTDNQATQGSHLYGVQFHALVGGTAGVLGTSAGGTGVYLQIREG